MQNFVVLDFVANVNFRLGLINRTVDKIEAVNRINENFWPTIFQECLFKKLHMWRELHAK